MHQSRNTGKVSNALAKVQAEFISFEVDKDGYNFSYLTLAKILEVALPIMGKHNVSIVQSPELEIVGDRPWVRLTTRVGCEDEWYDSVLSFPMIEMSKKTDTEIMMCASTVAYLRRISIQAILGIAGSDKSPEDMQIENIENTENK